MWRRILRCAAPAGAAWQQAYARACGLCPPGRPPRLLASPAIRSPLVAGLFRPLLLVPEGILPGADCMLAHELTHIRRRDIAFKALLTLVTAVHWYNPAAWLLQKCAARDIESACDADVLQGRGAAYREAYAEALLAAARSGRGPAFSTGFALSKRAFKARLAALWDTAPKRRGLLHGVLLVLLCANLAFLVSCHTAEGDAATATGETASGNHLDEPEGDGNNPAAAPVERAGQETAWLDVDYLYADPLPNRPAWLDTLKNCTYGRYQAPDEGRCGFAVPVGDGAVECYTSRDGGQNYTARSFDLSARLGVTDFSVPAFQMVSDDTGFLAVQTEASETYDTDSEVTIWRTRDGCATWQLMGRHACPEGTAHGSWNTFGFLWLNENVGFWTPHTRYDTFCVWRTVDGGVTWQELDLDFLYETAGWQALEFLDDATGDPIEKADVQGIHTCSLNRNPHSGTAGNLRVKCFARTRQEMDNQTAPGLAFWLVTDTYGESWRIEPYDPQQELANRTAPAPEASGSMSQAQALDAAQTYFEQEYAAPRVESGRCAVCQISAMSLVETEDFLADVDTPGDTLMIEQLSGSQPTADYLREREVQLVKVYFYEEYQPETFYLGPQYPDGDNTLYLAVEPQRVTPLTGWQISSNSGANPSRSEEAKALRLTQRQYLMLTHQTAALYAAGLTDFADPTALTGEQLARYLTVRGGADFGMEEGWLKAESPDQVAWMILNIDFTDAEDVWSVSETFPAERVRFSAGELAQSGTLPVQEPLAWSYTRDGDAVTAAGTDAGGMLRQTYTFAAVGPDYGSKLSWTARPRCTAAASYE